MNKNYPDNTVSAYIQFFNVLCWHCSVIAGELLDVRRNVWHLPSEMRRQ